MTPGGTATRGHVVSRGALVTRVPPARVAVDLPGAIHTRGSAEVAYPTHRREVERLGVVAVF